MKLFYYLKTQDTETVYQDEEIIAPLLQKEEIMDRVVGKTEILPTKEEILADIEMQKVAIYDQKTDKKTEIDTKTADVLLTWDGSSPFYEVVKGTSPTSVPFLGWPQVSKDDYVLPVEEPVPDIFEQDKL